MGGIWKACLDVQEKLLDWVPSFLPTGIKDCPKVVEEEEEENEKESIYEAVDPATGVNGNPTKQVAAGMWWVPSQTLATSKRLEEEIYWQAS